ncbi:aspartate phosphatase [Bacillus sp. LB7]|uniref:Rap family tetratricopeptide repeat protein n=1 Tax=Bacillus TaxID=1386 RepID=UPI002648C668|nr:Rap family tetratricopeptide repeat protein [Bacillus sp. LB7]MDN5390115.1 aspartate phosphatase [Bacillus sp. LB7]
METIPSSEVGNKINRWYNEIQKLNVIEAERLKAEVRLDIEKMEEDQDLLSYFQLMNFRHEIMLEYLFPAEKKKSLADYLREIEGQGRKLSGLLEYYSSFFTGMYHFSRGKYIKSIKSYRVAEKKLKNISDTIEKAEFYYKMAEVFYHMKQTHMSMYYVSLAHDIYKAHDAYVIRRINCLFVVAGNYTDLSTHDQALPHLFNALDTAKDIQNKPMIVKALINVACCYHAMENPSKAIEYFHKAIEVAEEIKAKELTQAYYDLALIHFRNNENVEGRKFYNKALKSARLFEDELFLYLLNVLDALFLKAANKEEVLEAMKPLRDSRGYPYLEELALEAALFYTRNERPNDSIFFYDQMVQAQKQIKRGDFLYEI